MYKAELFWVTGSVIFPHGPSAEGGTRKKAWGPRSTHLGGKKRTVGWDNAGRPHLQDDISLSAQPRCSIAGDVWSWQGWAGTVPCAPGVLQVHVSLGWDPAVPFLPHVWGSYSSTAAIHNCILMAALHLLPPPHSHDIACQQLEITLASVMSLGAQQWWHLLVIL